jgi:MYXO-CTERM domain-containing protein
VDVPVIPGSNGGGGSMLLSLGVALLALLGLLLWARRRDDAA